MSESFQFDVFLSHNRTQKPWTRDLAIRLRDSGFKVWFDEWVLRAGEVGSIGMERGLEESRHVVLVLSPEFIASEWTDYETQIALLLDPANRGRKLVPILHTKCDLPSRLKRIVWIDFSGTHGDAEQYDFRLAQLMSDLKPDRYERPSDFESFRASRKSGKPDAIPPVRPLPKGSRMPHASNPLFVGREEEMRALAQNLTPGTAGMVGVHAAVSGMGGVGKTQLAIEYAHRYGQRYPGGVFWLNFAKEEDIVTEVAACGGREGDETSGWSAMKLPEQAEKVQQFWQESEAARLLIFDNAEDPALVEQWRPKHGRCGVLITCRRDEWPAEMGVKRLPIETLPRVKSLELLAEVRPVIKTDSKEREVAGKICERLGDLPLALTVAAAYLRKYKSESVSEYLKALSAELVIQDPSLEKVSASIGVSVNKLNPENQIDALAQKLFYMASWFAPVSINRELLAASAGLKYTEKESRHQADDAMARLQELGLIKEEADRRVSLHRLLREFARLKTPQEMGPEAAIKAVGNSLIDFGNQEMDGGLPQALASERIHLRHTATEAEQLNPELAASLYNLLGLNGSALALFREAKGDHESAVKLGEMILGSDHFHVAIYVNNLGTVLKDLGNLAGARANFERALKIDESVYGPDHPTAAIRLNNLGGVLKELGDLAGARANYERALKIGEAVHGLEHQQVAIYANNLGLVLQDLGDLAGARTCLERALKIDEVVYGSDHPNVATDVSNLGSVLTDLGDLAGARANFERALKIDEAVYGSDHPNVAIRVNNLGLVLQELGDLEGARANIERALKIDEAVYGSDHPNVAIRVNNLGLVLQELGDLEGARANFERALQIDEAVYGSDHPQVAIDVNNLGSVLQELGDLAGARANFDRALKIFKTFLGDDHSNTRTVQSHLDLLSEKE
jgi:tetratricopeptide (TPR) repeat protein